MLSPKLTGKKSKLESEKSKSIKSDSPESEKEFNFDSNKIQKIRIGRNKKNEIFYDDMTLSRIHCT